MLDTLRVKLKSTEPGDQPLIDQLRELASGKEAEDQDESQVSLMTVGVEVGVGVGVVGESEIGAGIGAEAEVGDGVRKVMARLHNLSPPYSCPHPYPSLQNLSPFFPLPLTPSLQPAKDTEQPAPPRKSSTVPAPGAEPAAEAEPTKAETAEDPEMKGNAKEKTGSGSSPPEKSKGPQKVSVRSKSRVDGEGATASSAAPAGVVSAAGLSATPKKAGPAPPVNADRSPTKAEKGMGLVGQMTKWLGRREPAPVQRPVQVGLGLEFGRLRVGIRVGG